MSPADVQRLHAAHKLELMARSPRAYRELGRLVAEGIEPEAYRRRLADALAEEPTRGRNANALRHAAGYLPRPERAEAAAVVDAYERGDVGLADPRRFILDAAERHGLDYLLAQTFLRADA